MDTRHLSISHQVWKRAITKRINTPGISDPLSAALELSLEIVGEWEKEATTLRAALADVTIAIGDLLDKSIQREMAENDDESAYYRDCCPFCDFSRDEHDTGCPIVAADSAWRAALKLLEMPYAETP